MAPALRDHWDLLLAAAVAVATGAVVALRPDSPLRPVLGLALVGLVPGYALVAALFPNRPTSWGPDGGPRSGEGQSGRRPDGGRRGRRPDESQGAPMAPAERFVVSVGASVALVALLGIGLSAAGLGIRFRWILSILPGFTLAACLVAAWRRERARLPADESI